MGRIDDALKRAAENTPRSHHVTTTGTPFASPWSVTAAPDAPSVPAHAAAPLLQGARPDQFSGFAGDWGDRLVVRERADHNLVEQFRHLAGALHQAQVADNNLKVLMVTSALEADGKTLTALNLALTLSGSYGRRVLLVDADLRSPSIARICGLENTNGLSEGLRSATEQKLPIVQLGGTLTLLPAGRPDPDPMSSLTSPRMHAVVQQAAESFDWVILDAPPAAPLADAGLLASLADKVLLVVRALQTPYPAVAKAIEALGRDRIFGVVLNGVEESGGAAYNAYGYAARRSESQQVAAR